MAKNHSSKIETFCLMCHKSISIWPHEARAGHGKFCSRSCSSSFIRPVRKRRKDFKQVTCTCQLCGKVFLTKNAETRRGGGKFCSRECYRQGACIPIGRQFLNAVGEPNADGCILWAGTLTADSYGRLGSTSQRRNVAAHRFAFELAYGPIPDRMGVRHLCDQPACVNPLHLAIGTQMDNMKDKVARNRQYKGEDCHLAKLTADQVREIRRRYAAGEATQVKLASEFDTCVPNISAIIARRSWKHVT